jgi:hypothetical protein
LSFDVSTDLKIFARMIQNIQNNPKYFVNMPLTKQVEINSDFPFLTKSQKLNYKIIHFSIQV